MTQKELIKSWLVRSKAVEKAHFEFSLIFHRRHYFWGGLLISSSALTSALTAVTESKNLGSDNYWMFGSRLILAIFVPLCAATVTFLKYESRASRHHDAAARFASIKRRLAVVLSRLDDGEKVELSTELEKVRREWDELTLNMPAIPKKKMDWEYAVDKAQKEIEQIDFCSKSEISGITKKNAISSGDHK